VAVDSQYGPVACVVSYANITNSAFKFLPVMPEYLGQAFNQVLPSHLSKKWRFRTEYKDDKEAFLGDGSRGGPERRELNMQEKSKL
jgi:sarcosine oxidase/L-pipecolate oxidase